MGINLNPMGEFFERLGHRIIKSPSSWWYEVQPKVLFSFPYYKLIEPSEAEIKQLFDEYKLHAIRYSTLLESFGFFSVVELNTDPNYDLSCVQPRVRRYIKRALKENCKVERLNFDYLAKHGLLLNRDTANRQARKDIYTESGYWEKYCQAAKATPGITAWGAIINGQLGTYLVTAESEGWWNWLLTSSSEALSRYRTSHVLFYEATRQFFKNNPNKKICYGLGSLEPVPELDHFKVKMGITRKPIKQRLIFSKKLRLAFSLAQEPSLKLLNIAFSKNYTVRKLTNMIRLYRQQTYDIPFETQGNNLKQ